MSQGTREGHLPDLCYAVLLRTRQLQQAVRTGNDDLVLLLDRELDPLISAIVDYRAQSPQQIHQQLRFVSDLVRQDSDDRSCVVRYSEALAILLDRYFGDNAAPLEANLPLRTPRELSKQPTCADDIGLNEAILDALPDRIFVVTRDCRYLYANAAYAAFVDVDPLDLIGRHLGDIIGEDALDIETKQDLDLCFAGQTVAWRSKGRLPSGALGAAIQLIPMQAGRGPVIGAIVMERDLA